MNHDQGTGISLIFDESKFLCKSKNHNLSFLSQKCREKISTFHKIKFWNILTIVFFYLLMQEDTWSVEKTVVELFQNSFFMKLDD